MEDVVHFRSGSVRSLRLVPRSVQKDPITIGGRYSTDFDGSLDSPTEMCYWGGSRDWTGGGWRGGGRWGLTGAVPVTDSGGVCVCVGGCVCLTGAVPVTDRRGGEGGGSYWGSSRDRPPRWRGGGVLLGQFL